MYNLVWGVCIWGGISIRRCIRIIVSGGQKEYTSFVDVDGSRAAARQMNVPVLDAGDKRSLQDDQDAPAAWTNQHAAVEMGNFVFLS